MGILVLAKPFICVFAFVVAATAYAGAEEDVDRGWKETATDMNTIKLVAEKKYPCRASGQNTLACVKLINGLGQRTKPKLAYVPAGATPGGMEVKVLIPGQYLNFVEILKPAAAPDSVREFADKIKKEEAELFAAATALREAGKTIDFVGLAEQMVDARDPALEVSSQRMIGDAINEMIRVHDGHGSIAARDWEIKSLESADLSFGGLGLEVKFKKGAGRVSVVEPVEGGPAARAGIRPRDVIMKIDGADTQGMSLEAVVGKLRGPIGTTVKVAFDRSGQTVEVDLTRELVEAKNVKPKMLETMGGKIAYLRVGRFDAKVCDDVKAGLGKLLAEKDVKGVILDLRDDPGGHLDQAVCLGGVFAGPKVIAGIRDVKDSVLQPKLRQMISEEKQAATDLPLVVMINEGSASASEVVSGALQDHRRAVVLGTRSFGKATVQTIDRWKAQGDLNLRQTTARFYQPSDRTNQIVGILPDIEVFAKPNPNEEEKFAMREAESVPSALQPLSAAWVQPRPADIAQLNGCFQQRAETAYAADDQADYQLLKAQELAVCPAFAKLNAEAQAAQNGSF